MQQRKLIKLLHLKTLSLSRSLFRITLSETPLFAALSLSHSLSSFMSNLESWDGPLLLLFCEKEREKVSKVFERESAREWTERVREQRPFLRAHGYVYMV